MREKEKSGNKSAMWGLKVGNVLHKLFVLLGRCVFLLVAYFSGPPETQPPIKDLTLLHSASALALKIRNKQVSFKMLLLDIVK